MGGRYMEQLDRILEGSIEPQDIRLSVLEEITENFSEERIIGKGGFGNVYKGILQNGKIAVKRIKNNLTIDEKLFCQEVDVLRKVNHQNIVRFLGFCSTTMHKAVEHGGPGQYIYAEDRERILCFEYINNGSLDKYIADELRGVEWNTRYEMIKGICEGLKYLHVEKHLIHMDLKPANILLDNHMVAKIADFGLSRMDEYTHTQNPNRFLSLGYCAPEYLLDGNMSVKSDVYSLGVIIIELVTGQKGTPENNNVLRRWRHRGRKSGKETPLKYLQISKLIEIGLLCQDKDPYKRPFISEILSDVNELENMDGKISNANQSTVKQISPYSEDDMLGIEPLELHFPFELNKKITCSIELTNETSSYIAFSIQTTSHLPYCTQPGKGIVQPQSSRSVNITLQPLDRAPPLDKQHTRDFIVRSTKVKEILTDEDINEGIFNIEEGKIVDEVTLTVVYKTEVPKVDLNSPDESDVPSAKAGSTVVDFPSMEDKKQCTSSSSANVEVIDEEPTIVPPNLDDSSLQSRTTHVDEEPASAFPISGTRSTPQRVQLVIKSNKTAPLLENEQTVMLELTGGDYTSDRPGLDLVLVADVGTSFGGKRVKEVEIAMHFVVQKLGPLDRLSVVSCATTEELCPLREVTEIGRQELLELITDGIKVSYGGANIEDGLLNGLKVLADRKVSAGRVAAIILVCDEDQSQGDASMVSVGDVPVYTFGYNGAEHMVLSAVAANSLGGTFSHVPNVNETRGALTMAFSQCLAGLLTVSAQDLELRVAPVGDESRMVKTSAGSYPQTQGGDGSVTVRFGNLYSGEVRKVIVDLRFAACNVVDHSFEITYSYSSTSSSSSGGRERFVRPLTTHAVEEDNTGVHAEKARMQVVELIQQAAQQKDWPSLRQIIVEAQKMDMLEDPLLTTELQIIHDLFRGYGTWSDYAYVISFLSSHNRQRSTARSTHTEIMRLFATPCMLLYLDQAMEFYHHEKEKEDATLSQEKQDTTQHSTYEDDGESPGGYFIYRPAYQEPDETDTKSGHRRLWPWRRRA